jgi:hypothetical protein
VAAWLLASVTVSNKAISNFLPDEKLVLTVVDQPAVWWCVEIATPFLVGFMVAAAIRLATRGRSSRTCQVLAVLLTGAAVILCHVTITRTVAGGMTAVGNTRYLLSAGNRSPSLFAFIVDTLVLPWLILFFDPTHGFTMVLPSAIALSAVWRLTGRDDALIMGPYSLSGSA